MNGDIAQGCANRPDQVRHQRVNAILHGLDVTTTKLTDEHAPLADLLAVYEAACADLAELEASA